MITKMDGKGNKVGLDEQNNRPQFRKCGQFLFFHFLQLFGDSLRDSFSQLFANLFHSFLQLPRLPFSDVLVRHQLGKILGEDRAIGKLDQRAQCVQTAVLFHQPQLNIVQVLVSGHRPQLSQLDCFVPVFD